MIGRVREVKVLNRLYSRDKAELVAVYGRRRVRKTYLVDETFADRITFRHAGLSPADEDARGLLKLQLNHFYNSLELQGMEKCDKPSNWLDAFLILEKFWQQNVTAAPVVIWRGFAFENVCFNHVEQIKRSLGISGVITETSAWSKKEDDTDGVQNYFQNHRCFMLYRIVDDMVFVDNIFHELQDYENKMQ